MPSRCLRKSAGGCLTAAGKLLPHVYDLTYEMPRVLQRFKQRAPKVRLSLQSLNCYSIRDALLADEVDGCVYRVGNDDALTIMELGQQSLALVASVEQAQVDFMRPRQHIPLSFIINEPQCVFRQILKAPCASAKLLWRTPLSCGVLRVSSSAWREIWE